MCVHFLDTVNLAEVLLVIPVFVMERRRFRSAHFDGSIAETLQVLFALAHRDFTARAIVFH